jgi:hypothetical protein
MDAMLDVWIESDRIDVTDWHRECPLVGIKLTVSAIGYTHTAKKYEAFDTKNL